MNLYPGSVRGAALFNAESENRSRQDVVLIFRPLYQALRVDCEEYAERSSIENTDC